MKIAAGLVFCLVLIMAKVVVAAPAPPVTGTIASNRLGAEQVELLKAASRTEAFANYASAGASGTRMILGKNFTRSLVRVLLNDDTYSSTDDFRDDAGNSRTFSPNFTFTLHREDARTPYVDVAIDPATQELRVLAPFAKIEHHPTELYAHYTLTAQRLTDLIQQAFPESRQAQSLKAWPEFVKPIPSTVPPSIQARIAVLHPGMTRRDVLNLLDAQGGAYSVYSRTYLWRGAGAQGGLIKVDVQFMPKEAHIKWIHGQGILIDPAEFDKLNRTYRDGMAAESGDDIIVKISPPYLGGLILD